MDARTAKKNEVRDLERLAEYITRWAVEGRQWAKRGDVNMAKMHTKDCRDLGMLADAVKAGDYDRAVVILCRLDTVILERIPRRLYKAIERKAS